MKKFKTIVCDPPWPYKGSGPIGTGGMGERGYNNIQVDAASKYGLLSIRSLKFMDVSSLAEKHSHLYLWTTNSFMCEAHDIAKAWGFEPKTILTWVKVHKLDKTKPSMKTGFYFRSATEHVLFAVRGRLKLRGPARPTAYLSWRLPHSVKPKWFYRLVEEQSPGPYLELFCRRPRVGWDFWGNEVESTIKLSTSFR